MTQLSHTTNPFGGVLTVTDKLPRCEKRFSQLLDQSLTSWRKEGFQVAWLELQLDQAKLIPIAVDRGFKFHHSDEHYTMMTLRLCENAFVPAYASHYIGAGGVVLTDDSKLLVVSEKYQRNNNSKPRYKLPGGTLNHGENLAKAVVREVMEETGVKVRFESLVCFRHWHGYRYGKSDIYFVCRLKPLSKKITIQEEEIAECRWMNVEDYLNDENISDFNKQIVQAAITHSGLVQTQIKGYDNPEDFEFFMPDR